VPFINKINIGELEVKAALLKRCSMQTYWMRQRFVTDFLDAFLRGEDISRLRDTFDRALESYVNERCAEKLEQANKLIDEIDKINTTDPFHGVRLAIAKYKGER